MGIYTHLYTQKFTLKRVNGTDENSEPNIVETLVDEPCKVEFKNRLILNAQGAQVSSQSKLFTDSEVSVEDIVNYNGKDYTVIQANPLYDLDGITQAYQVYF